MIIQDIDDSTKLVYVAKPDTEYVVIGNEFGICDRSGNVADYATVAHRTFTNSNGVQVPAWYLSGKTVTLIVVCDHVDNVHDPRSMADALNCFHRPIYRYDKYVYAGKFNARMPYTVIAHDNRTFNMNMRNLKDLPGIYELMSNIGVNNGKLFEPLAARYVSAMRVLRGTEVKAVGYFDLGEYLHIIRDSRKELFNDTKMKTHDIVVDVPSSGCTVRISGVDKATGQAIMALDGATVIDANKSAQFTPHVIISTAPLNIRDDMPFKSTRVMYGRLPLFLTPMMSSPNAWQSLTGGIDLLSTDIY